MPKVDWAGIDTVDPTTEIIALFKETNKFELVEGKPSAFIGKSIFVLSFLTLFKYLFNVYLPSLVELVLTIAIITGAVFLLRFVYDQSNKYKQKFGLRAIAVVIGILIVLNILP